ncbi:MAG TPA: DNA alkylation repair protein [Gemmatimonadaceae bacterium]|nr:DNA alkylation repair protein [Gemmatimonadaceae bacterium]
MADALKLQFGPDVVTRLADEIHAVHPAFDRTNFAVDALHGFEALELLDRGRHLGAVLQRHLPADFGAAVAVLLATLPAERSPAGGMSSFYYLAHTEFVRQHGLPHFEHSMRALHALTQVFTGEFAIRPFLEQHQAATLERLHQWAADGNVHVRRLVCEGTRPRLPWAPRLRAFQRDPEPVLSLLMKLRDDHELYVRRSVANNLNDIGKDHPALLVQVARDWLDDATPARRWIVQHALRSLVRRGDAAALTSLGFAQRARLDLVNSAISPARAIMGGKVRITCTLRNSTAVVQRVVVDLRVHFVKAHGGTSVKVFKLAARDFAPGESVTLRKTVSLADLTTRRHYPGEHLVELQMNGVASPLGSFTLQAQPDA